MSRSFGLQAGERSVRRPALTPTTDLGKWALGLGAASCVLLLGWSLVGRLGGMPGLAFGLAAGVLALVAIARDGERSLGIWLAFVPFVPVVAFLLAQAVGTIL